MNSTHRHPSAKGMAAGFERFGCIKDSRKHYDFQAINAAALAALPDLLAVWLPDGKRQSCEYVARNPRRADRKAGSFRVNLRTGRWADFACADVRGGDAVSLCAYLHGLSQIEAARKLAVGLGVSHG